MPYTISHIAAAVPFARQLARWHVLSAFVIGSMVPDFGYFLPNDPPRFVTHSAMALVTFCLPVGLFSYWIFQRLLKAPLLSVLPDQAYMRWRPYATAATLGRPLQWLLAACGVFVGAAIHLAWDAFTHVDSRGVRMVPELNDPVLEVHDHAVRGWLLLQALSSLIGLLVVIAAIVYALRSTGRVEVTARVLNASERRTWALVFLLTTLGFCVAFLILDPRAGPYRWRWIGGLAVALLRALILASLCIGLLMQAYLARRGRQA